jgi:AraC family transcriptional regulator
MATDTQPKPDHHERIQAIKQYIREHMDEPLNRDLLAELAGFSVPHFHRIFTAHVGETISAYVRRMRMEGAARQLRAEAANITEIALASGYESHSTFGKAFKLVFGVSPTEFRELNCHAAAHLLNRHIVYQRKELAMQPLEIRTLPDTPVLYARATETLTSPAFQSAPMEAMNKLMGYVLAHHRHDQVRQVIAIYPDEPEIGQEVRCDAGVIFAAGVQPPAPDGLAYQTLPGGRWAIFRHTGLYDTLWQSWQAIYRDWLPTSGYELRDALPFEDYVDDPNQVAAEQLRTDIFIPIR